MCSWCQTQCESDMHILFQCCFAQELWTAVGMQYLISNNTASTVMEVLKSVCDRGTREQGVLVVLFCWSLWTRRNKWLWEKINVSVFGVKSMALNLLAEWRNATEVDKIKRGAGIVQTKRWCKPPDGWIKINIDAACRSNSDFIGVGCVVRNERGEFLRARTNMIRIRGQAREAEAVSLKEPLSWIKNWRTSKCIFESDAKTLVDALQGRPEKSIFDTLVEVCRELMKHFQEVSVKFVNRSANMSAHMLAQATYSTSGPQEWLVNPPDFIICNLSLEAI